MAAHSKRISNAVANKYSGWYELSAIDQLKFAHYLVPGQNLNSSIPLNSDLSKWHREPFPLKCSYHLPFLPPNEMSNIKLQEGDPATSLIIKKHQWEYFLSNVEKKSRTYDYDFQAFSQSISGYRNRVKIAKYEAYFLHLLNVDPDPDFAGLTNWWYSGGRVSHMLVGGQTVLLTSCGEKNEKLCVVPISDESGSWQAINSGAMDFPTSANETIYQIVSSSKKSGRHNLVGLRQRNACTLISLQLTDDSFEQREDKCWEVKYDQEAFTSLDFNPYKFGNFCTSTVGRLVSIWDAKNSCCVSNHVVQKQAQNLSNFWTSLQYIDANTLVMSDPSTLMFLDIRQAFDKPVLTYCPHDQKGVALSCEDISLIFRSCNKSAYGRHMYCATSHHAFLFDARNSQAVQLWTHMLHSPPIYGHSVPMGTTETKELVCIANQDPADTQLIVNDWYKPDEIPRSAVFPFCVPSLLNSAHLAQTSGQVLDPLAFSRMKSSVAGVSCIPTSSPTAYSLITQTSAGDVFVQELRELIKNVTYTKKDLRKFKNWEKCVLNIKSEPKLKLTTLYQSDSIMNAIKDTRNKLPRHKKKVCLPESIKCSISELFLYKDILASKLLQAWDIGAPSPDHESSDASSSDQDGEEVSSETPKRNQSPKILTSELEVLPRKTSEKKRKASVDYIPEVEIAVPKLNKKEKRKNSDFQGEELTISTTKKKKRNELITE